MNDRSQSTDRVGLACLLGAACLLSVVAAAQPGSPAEELPEFELRTWHDDTGKFQVEAAFVELQGDNVHFRKADGRTIHVPFARLREEDRPIVIADVLIRVEARMRRGELDKALAEVENAVRIDPRIAASHATLAKVWILRKDLPRAMEVLNEGINATHVNKSLHLLRSSVHNALGKREPAVADYRKYAELSGMIAKPDSPPAGDFDRGQPADSQSDGWPGEPRPLDERPPPNTTRKPPFKITVSRETTRVLDPLREDGSVDYLAALNAYYRRGVTPENNAVTVLFKAMGPQQIYEADRESFFQSLGMSVPPPDGPYFVPLEKYIDDLTPDERPAVKSDHGGAPWRTYAAALRRPWAPKEFPVLANWIRANDEPLRRVVEASGRPRYYEPLVMDYDDLPLLSAWMPTAESVADASRGLVCRAMFRLQAGEVSQARQDLLACHRLARLVEQGPTLVHGLFAVRITSFACSGDAALARFGKLTARQARQYAADLDKLPPRPNFRAKIDMAERCNCLDTVVRVALGGPAEFEDILHWVQYLEAEPGAVDPVEEPSLRDRMWLYNETLDWDEVLRIVNQWYDKLVAAHGQPDRATRVAALEQRDRATVAMADRIQAYWPPVTMASFHNGVVAPETTAQHMAALQLSLTLPNFLMMEDAGGRATTKWRLCRLTYALAGFRADKGGYPDKLSQLSPAYIDEVPVDLFTGKELRYERVADDDYRLYSLGPNGEDDGGADDEDVTEWDPGG